MQRVSRTSIKGLLSQLQAKGLETTSIGLSRCRSSFNQHNDQSEKRRYGKVTTVLLSLTGGITYYLYKDDIKNNISSFINVHAFKIQNSPNGREAGARRAELPTYTMQQVSEHDNLINGIWVSYKEGVYNITDFVRKHPGGQSKIMMAAGGSIDPFWMIFANHQTDEILVLLESMRIGNLRSEDVYKHKDEDIYDPYALEPVRNQMLHINGKKPFCAEPPPPMLVKNFITPKEVFYVRNHLPVPYIDEENYELELAAEEKTMKTFNIEDIKKYPQHTITSAIMCGGNRRSEMGAEKPLKGLSWNVGAIGNASWTGAKLSDVLRDLGVKEEDYNHIQFEGMDIDPSGVPYGASIPISKALDPRADVLLAYKMNGEDIPLDHGYPLRVIVPGVVGARNVKWVNRIILSKNESPSQFQQNDYKGFSPSINWDNVDFKTAPAIQEMPVTSAICCPQKDEKITVAKDGTIPVKGYAWSGGGKKIIRVDVTADQGETWHIAELVAQDPDAKEGRHYAWTLWSLNLPVDKMKKSVEIWVKAVDSQYNTQPESFKNIWNLRGFLCNAYHKVKVNLG
ncbi:hypothetical protein TKK_0000044 [Trichogramma kaykai]|uniref:sulfite oxidase n=1 Tax=Trichogramma kaykai TaxID=54128 RepID=A0ABD2VU00_9HYME